MPDALQHEDWDPPRAPARRPLREAPDTKVALPAYAELHCLSNFSFQRGASHPHELVARAHALGYSALALTDECSVAGMVRAWKMVEALRNKESADNGDADDLAKRPPWPAPKLLMGSEFTLPGARLVAIAHNLQGWGNLCECISFARGRDAGKGYRLDWDDAAALRLLASHCEVLHVPDRPRHAPDAEDAVRTGLLRARALFGTEHLWLAVELFCERDDALWLALLQALGQEISVPLVAAGDVHMHVRSRKPLQDVISAVRLGKPVAECGFALQANAERRLRHRVQLARIYPAELLANTLRVADRCCFRLDEISYNYPRETVPEGLTPTQALQRLTMEGAGRRYPAGIPERVLSFLEKELALIAECHYEMFFLTVEDIVRFARAQGILCQGRGSAANSVVCYCLGITAMDPMHSSPLLERFISLERRNEPPDIDVDFEHERREEVIQYIYGKYGRARAAIAAVVITYRRRSAIRDVGAALGIAPVLVDAFAKEHQWFDDGLAEDKLQALAQQTNTSITPRQALLWLELVAALHGFPRHLSQHVGGFVLTQDKLTRLVAVENATMEKRSIIQWEKDDLEHMKLMKVDVLALGMLSALRRCLQLRNAWRGTVWDLADVPNEDAATYGMIQRADTVGVFQIESRAQMSMLPRLKPREFYDLVVEVAIVRPGPIQGGMVHPYLLARARKAQKLPIHYEKPELKAALERTLGVPIFQEQVMQLSMIAAGFTATKADALRRAMAAWKRTGNVRPFQEPLLAGMLANGYRREFAERIFKQIEGFGEYGFPESHAYSFALLAYASSWLKCHEPACFLAALLNAQPMGFYPPSQLIQDARRHGVEVRPADVSHSDWDCTLETAVEPGLTAVEDSQENAGPLPSFLAPPRGAWRSQGWGHSQENAGPPQVFLHPLGGPGASQGWGHSDPGFPQPAVRLGLRLVSGFGKASAERIVTTRVVQPFTDVQELSLRADLDARDLTRLAAADALRSLAGHRRQQTWQAAARHRAPTLLREAPVHEQQLLLPPAGEGEDILFDYAATGFSLRRHPLALLRPRLARMNMRNAAELAALPHGQQVQACGLVTVRQQPQTAKGTIFVTLEDETGPVNVIVWKHVREAQREALLRARLLAVQGTWQRDVDSGGNVCHLVAQQLTDLTPLLGRLGELGSRSRDFH